MIEKIRKLLFNLFKKESFIGKIIDKFFTQEIVLYVFFGVLTTVVNLVTFYLFKKLFISIGWEGALSSILPPDSKAAEIIGGSEYLDANCIAWVVAVIFAFITNKLWVFESKTWSPSVAGKEFAGFIGARIFSFAVETLMMFVFVSLFSMNDLIAKIIIGVVVIIMNYVFSKLIIFKKK